MPELASWTAVDDGLELEALIRLLNQRMSRGFDLLARCQRLNQRVVAVSGPVTESDDVVFVDATAADVTLALPPAAGRQGYPVVIHRIAGAHNIIADPFGAELIDGGATLTTTSARILSNGTAWRSLP